MWWVLRDPSCRQLHASTYHEPAGPHEFVLARSECGGVGVWARQGRRRRQCVWTVSCVRATRARQPAAARLGRGAGGRRGRARGSTRGIAVSRGGASAAVAVHPCVCVRSGEYGLLLASTRGPCQWALESRSVRLCTSKARLHRRAPTRLRVKLKHARTRTRACVRAHAMQCLVSSVRVRVCERAHTHTFARAGHVLRRFPPQ